MNKRIRKYIRIAVVAVMFCGLVAVTLFSVPTLARSEVNSGTSGGDIYSGIIDASIIDKVRYNGLITCYPNYMAREYTSSSSNYFYVGDVASNTPDLIVVPTFVADKDKNNLSISCRELFLGVKIRSKIGDEPKYDFPGLLDDSKIGSYTPGDLGYVPAANATTNTVRCIRLKYSYTPPVKGAKAEDKMTTSQLCVPVDSSGVIRYNNIGEIMYEYINDETPGALQLLWDASVNAARYTVIDAVGSWTAEAGYIDNGNTTFSGLLDQIRSNLSNGGVGFVRGSDGESYVTVSNATAEEVSGSNTGGEATASDRYTLDGNSALTALRYFSPSASYASYSITDDDVYNLYKGYMNYVIGAYNNTVKINSSKCSTSKDEYSYAWTEDKINWCEVDGAEDVTEWFGGFSTGTRFPSTNPLSVMSFRDILKSVKNLNLDRVSDESIGTITGDNSSNDGTTAGEAGTIAPCYEGTGVLGWIVCPVLEAVGAATGWMYNSVIEPALEIKTSILFSDRSDSGVYGAWSAFRTFANILFAIAFVIIILSQVTGIGITNYGIKKMLPRLIIVVVLVNISYILCQLAVDVSNILGSSLKSLFEGIEIPGVEGDSFVTSIGMILNGLGLAGAAGFGVTAVLSLTVVQAGLSYLAIPLVLTVIGCLIAIIFFFILLSVRQAGVVVLVVLAPLAVVCYALPNTKSLFDRWRKLFTAMLFVYPICGIVMGGGNFVSALLLSMLGKDGGLGFFYTVSAMLVSVVPFFMIPSILKSSMAMAGNLGAKISNFGAGLSNGLNRGIRNSELYKDHQLEEARRLGIRRNQVKRDRLSATGEGGGLVGKFRRAYGLNNNLSNRQRAIVGRSQSSLDRATDERALALRSAMEQSGMADDQDALLSEFNTATDALLANENDFEALERQKAAAGLLLRNGKGRSVLLDSLQKRATSIAGMSDEKKAVNAMRTMQRSLSSLDRTYGADIAKSPILKEQVKNMRNLKDYGTRANYANVNKTSLKDSSESLNSRVMSEASKHDLNAYLKAIEDGDIKYGDREFNAITSAAAGALSDKNFKGNIDEEALAPMRKLAGMKFNPPAAAGASFEDISASIADASDDEMSHLQSYLQDNATPAAEKADIIANLSRTLGRSLSTNPADASFKLNSSRTQQLGDILSKNGQKIGDVGVPYGINRQTAEDRFDLDTGVRIDHSNHKTLNDYHPDWQHANHDNISGAYKKGDWVEAIRDSSGAIVDYRKLDPREVKEADKLEDKDIEVKHSEIDQENAAKRRWNRP